MAAALDRLSPLDNRSPGCGQHAGRGDRPVQRSDEPSVNGGGRLPGQLLVEDRAGQRVETPGHGDPGSERGWTVAFDELVQRRVTVPEVGHGHQPLLTVHEPSPVKRLTVSISWRSRP